MHTKLIKVKLRIPVFLFLIPFSSMISGMEKSLIQQVSIERLIYGGDGLAHLADGRTVFVLNVIPQEKAAIRLIGEKKKHVYGEVSELLSPSAERIEAPCDYFGICGGCQYQHIRYAAQIKYKKQILQEQLKRLAHLEQNVPIEVFPSDLIYGYRNVLQFHLLPNGKLGFMKRNSHEIFALEQCLLAKQEIRELSSAFSFEAQTDITRIEMRQNTVGDVLVIMEGGKDIPKIETDRRVNLVHSQGNENIVLSGEDALVMNISGVPFHLSAGSFFQVNEGITEKMVAYVVALAKKNNARNVLDLYAGVGLFSRFLAPLVKEIIAVENNPHACYDFIINLDAFNNISLYEGAVEMILPALPIQADLAICDPPRAGLHENVLQKLGESGISTLIYVSCDPATLARDISRLVKSGFSVENIALFDMFPQTYHVETVVLMSCKDK